MPDLPRVVLRRLRSLLSGSAPSSRDAGDHLDAVANAMGNGVADDKLFYTYVPLFDGRRPVSSRSSTRTVLANVSVHPVT